MTVDQMVILFLDAKKLSVQSGEMAARTWKEYEAYGKRMVRVFGRSVPVESLGPDDFTRLRADFQKTHKSLLSLKGDLGKSRLFLNWVGPGAHGQSYISRMPRFRVQMEHPLKRQSPASQRRLAGPVRTVPANLWGRDRQLATWTRPTYYERGPTDRRRAGWTILGMSGREKTRPPETLHEKAYRVGRKACSETVRESLHTIGGIP